MDIKMFKMGFGESILLSENRKQLLVDCGSHSSNTAPNHFRTTFFNEVANSLQPLRSNPRAIISHFHEDHINGLLYLIRHHNITFDTVYIPNIFIRGRHPNPVDFAIVQDILEHWKFPHNQTLSLWRFLLLMIGNRRPIKHIKLLQRENRAFQFSNKRVDVLWPCQEELIDDALWTEIEEAFPILREYKQKIFALSDDISQIYLALNDQRGGANNQPYDQNINIQQRTQRILQDLRDLSRRFKALLGQPGEDDDPRRRTIIERLFQKPNETSIVCQIHGDKGLLLTGDITSAIMRRIAKNACNPSIPLLDDYYAIKAPHHGTCTHFFNFRPFTKFRFLLISNGNCGHHNYHGVSSLYCPADRNYSQICTNDIVGRCEHLDVASPCAQRNDQCCCDPARNAPFLNL